MRTFFRKICLLMGLFVVYSLAREGLEHMEPGMSRSIISISAVQADDPHYEDVPVTTTTGDGATGGIPGI